MENKVDTWSKAEKEILSKYYTDGGSMTVFVKLARLGSKHTTVDVNAKAIQLGLKHKPKGKNFDLQRSKKEKLVNNAKKLRKHSK